MSWQADRQRQRWHTTIDGWHAVVQRAQQCDHWRPAVTPPHPGIGRVAPVIFTSRKAAEAWCIAVIRQSGRESAGEA